MSPQEWQNLLARYNVIQAEITRYRDREWKNVSLFTTALAAIVAFILVYGNDVTILLPKYKIYFMFALGVLTLGLIFYSMYAHIELYHHCNVESRIHKYFKEPTQSLDNDSKKLLFDKPDYDTFKDRLKSYFSRGFLSHLIPFFVADILLMAWGINMLC